MKIELPGGVATDMVKAVETARSRDASRENLTGIYWEIADGVHTFSATDGYRLHTISIPDPGATYADSVLLSGDIVKAVQSCAKSVGKEGTVTLEKETMGDYNTHCMVSGVVKERTISQSVVGTLSAEFPTCRSIIDGANDIELPALFNGKYLAGLIDAATLWAGKNGRVSVESIHARKPSRIISNNDYGTFTGIVMPQRVGE